MGIAGGVGDIEHAGGGLAVFVAQGERAGGSGVGHHLAADGGLMVGDHLRFGDRGAGDVGVGELAAVGALGPGVGAGLQLIALGVDLSAFATGAVLDGRRRVRGGFGVGGHAAVGTVVRGLGRQAE